MTSNNLQAEFLAFVAAHDDEIDGLVSKFPDYEPCRVNRAKIERWIAQFQPEHYIIGLKVAQSIRYYGTADISGLMPNIHSQIIQHIEQEGLTFEDAVFVPFGGVGESAQSIARTYRNACGVRIPKNQLAQALELPQKIMDREHPIIIFLDDFIGTGQQVSEAWEIYGQLVPPSVPCYLFVIGAFEEGISKIENAVPALHVIALHTFSANHRVNSDTDVPFTLAEKECIAGYCEKAGNFPLGFGEIGSLVSFAYSTPNNTISVIRGSRGQQPWEGLLPRWDEM